MGADAEDHYLARIQEVRDGFPALGNTFLPDKNIQPLLPGLGENILGRMGDLLGLSTPDLSDVMKFVLPFIATLLMYTFGYVLLRSRAAALIGTSITMFGDTLVSGPAAWRALIHGTSASDSFLTYARPINPEVSGIIFFAALISILCVFFRDRAVRWYEPIGIGVLTGVSFYVSPYVFSFLGMMLVLITLRALYERQWKRVLGAVGAGVIALCALIPFMLSYRSLVSNSSYNDTVHRFGLVVSHPPVFSAWVVIMLALALFGIPKRFSLARSFFLTAALALGILLNQQILTGHVLQVGHYHWYITKPLISFLIALYVVELSERLLGARKYVRYAAYAAGVALLCVNAGEVQIHSYLVHEPQTLAAQRYAPAMRFLGTLPTREFVWADEDLSRYVPIYTRHDVANDPQALNYLVPTSFFEDRLFINYHLQGIAPADVPTLMERERAQVSSAIDGIYWREQGGSFEAIPDPELASIKHAYTLTAHDSAVDIMARIGITLIVWDKAREPDWHIDMLSGAQEVFSAKGIRLYRMSTTRVDHVL
jgi:hypothetical protein